MSIGFPLRRLLNTPLWPELRLFGDFKMRPRRVSKLLPVIVLSVLTVGGVALAQTPPQPNTAPAAATTDNKKLDRQLNPAAASARRQKRDECQTQAKQQKLRLVARA